MTGHEERGPLRQQFGAAMQAMRTPAFSQDALGEAIESNQSTISSWERGEAEPPPHMVFAIEEACNRPPGSLSHILGYLPVEADEHSLELAIKCCPTLGPDERMVLGALYKLLEGCRNS